MPPRLDASSSASRGRAGRWARRIGIVIVVLIAVMLGAVAAVLFYAKSEIDDLVTPRTAEMRAAQQQLTKPLPNQPTNILLLGSDHRKATSGPDDKRSDTLLLVRLDPKRESISMISFPRDLYVNIPGHGESKINDAYSLGGPALSVETIKDVTGLDINMVMNVDFTGFKGVVDQLGGVWVDVDHTYFNPPNSGYDDIDLKPGYQLMDGRDALDFARFRHTDSDFHRIARQQQVLAGLKKQVGSSSLAKNVPGLFRVFKKNTEVVAGGGDDIDARVLYDYLRLALELDGKDVYQVEYAGGIGTAGNGASIVTYDKETMDDAVAAFLAPSAKAREQSADQLVGKQPPSAEAPGGAAPPATPAQPAAPKLPAPSTVSVKVLNGSGTGGAAATMAQSLDAAGYQVDPEQANADSANYASTKIFYAAPANRAAAEAMADGIEGATVGPKDASNEFSTQLLVVVGDTGTTFVGEGADGAIGTDGGPDADGGYEGNRVPEKLGAKVVSDPEGAREQFFEMSLRRLPIMYPTVREESSSFVEVHPYEFARGQKGSQTVYEAYRMVAKTASGDYWGVQGMTWHDPPLLESPTREVTRKGRTYRLYFNGTKLHMVAWRQGAGTYWLANSVLDKLSNETMLAIADSVVVYR